MQNNDAVFSIFTEAGKLEKQENIEVYCQSQDEDNVDIEMDQLKSIRSKKITGYGLRIIRNNKLGFTWGTDPSPENMVRRCLNSAEFGKEVRFAFPAPGIYENPQNYDKSIESLSIEAMVNRAEDILQKLKKEKKHVSFSVSISRMAQKKQILSGKLDISHSRTFYSIDASGHIFREGDFLDAGRSLTSTGYIHDSKNLIEKLISLIDNAQQDDKLSTGSYPAVFSPDGASSLLTLLLSGLSGKQIEKKSSPLSDKLGKKIFPDYFSIWSDGTADWSPSCAPFDDEGVPTGRNNLITDGVVENFILDLETASNIGLPPTGNGQRSYSSQPCPCIYSLFMRPGTVKKNKIIQGIGRGIFIEDLIGEFTGNPFSGEFQMNVDLGFGISHGKITGRLKNTMISGNIYKLLDSLEEISKETDWTGKFNLPWLKFEKINVTSI